MGTLSRAGTGIALALSLMGSFGKMPERVDSLYSSKSNGKSGKVTPKQSGAANLKRLSKKSKNISKRKSKRSF